MGYFKEKKKLLKLQNLIFNSDSKKLDFSESVLRQLAQENCQKILTDIQPLLNSANHTTEPITFFNCFDEIIIKAEELIKYEPYILFSGDTPTESLKKIMDDEDTSVFCMMCRCANSFCDELQKRDYENEEQAYLVFSKKFEKYVNRLSDKNIEFLKNSCKKQISEEYKKLSAKKKRKLENNISKNHINDLSIFDPLVEMHSIKQRFDIDVEWSDDGFFINNIINSNNYIFPRSHDDSQIYLINNIIKFSSPKTVKMILIDETTCFAEYRYLSSLAIPIITESKKAVVAINWLYTEMKRRYDLFVEFRCKDISSYNKLIEQNQEYIKNHPAEINNKGQYIQIGMKINGNSVAKEKLPHFVCIIHEYYNFIQYKELNESFTPLLLNSKAVGIHLFIFTKFSLGNLSLGAKSDLLKVCSKEDIESIFEKEKLLSCPDNIEDIDNNMTGIEFEQFCGMILKRNGFDKISVTQPSGDFGADVIAYKGGVKFAIQCKKYSEPVGVSAVQEVLASKSVYKCHVAVVLTNNYFTNSAVSLADTNDVLLWDRNYLLKMIDSATKSENKFRS